MITFLASGPTTELNEAHPIPMLNERNRFVDLLKQVWPQNARCLIIAAEPAVFPLNDEMTDCGIDGKLYVQDIARSHSMGRRFLAVPDGSFVLAADGEETVFGEAYLVADGEITPFCTEGETRRFL